MKTSRICLSESDVTYLRKFARSGSHRAVEVMRAKLLLGLHEGLSRRQLATALQICKATIDNVRRRYEERGLPETLYDRPRAGKPARITLQDEINVTALACSKPPEGFDRWSLRLLADHIVSLDFIPNMSHEQVRTILKKTDCNLIAKYNG